MTARARRWRRVATAVVAATLLSAVGVVSGSAPVSAELRLPAAPTWVTNTAKNLRVRALARLGNTMYVGGEFTQIMPMPGGPVVAQPYLFAVDATTGAWRSAFAPAITAPAGTELDPSGVLALETDPATGSVFVGGKFNTVNGQAVTGFAVLDATTGAFKSGVVQKPATRVGQRAGSRGRAPPRRHQAVRRRAVREAGWPRPGTGRPTRAGLGRVRHRRVDRFGAGRRGAGLRRRPRHPREDLPRRQVHGRGAGERRPSGRSSPPSTPVPPTR